MPGDDLCVTEVTRLNRPAGAGGEDQPGIGPGRTEVRTVFLLLTGVRSQGGTGEPEHGKIPSSGTGLDRAGAQLAMNTLDLLADMEDAAVEVDVVPAQAEPRLPPRLCMIPRGRCELVPDGARFLDSGAGRPGAGGRQYRHRSPGTASAKEPAAETLSLRGAFHLVRGIAAARDNDRPQAHRNLAQAGKIAGRIGEDRDDFGTEFSPTNVALHTVAVAVELGDAGQALDLARGIEPGRLSAERQARYNLDLA